MKIRSTLKIFTFTIVYLKYATPFTVIMCTGVGLKTESQYGIHPQH